MKIRAGVLSVVSGVVLFLGLVPAAFGSCAAPANAIEAENCKAGTPSTAWDINGTGDSSIQGFATDISFDRGQTVQFKVKTTATNYRLDIYRMGYYGGAGARLVASVTPSASLPQNQPACITDVSTALTDCGNWAVSASWPIPADATSGIYFANLVRTDTGGSSHVVFVVRNDGSTSEILFKTSDTTWQAYNDYGGSSLYQGGPGPKGGAYKVSYNRPFTTRSVEFYSWVFNAEYPMVRWLEANGYDVSYFSSLDADRLGALIQQHKALVSVGHDEYWSGNERANVEAARAAGIHLAFFTGNGIFWKTRWESSIDGTNTANRTLVSYKETHANAVSDPQDPPIWTGTWRDQRFSPPGDGGRPENGLKGTIFMVNGPGPVMDMKVPAADGKMRIWRNTSVANLAVNQTFSTSVNLLGYEWDVDADNGFRPAGLFRLSNATFNINGNYLLDNGSTYGNGTATHSATLYRYLNAGRSALVFDSATSQWPWALDGNHDGGSTTPDVNIRQATVNLFADMGIQPTTLQSGLVAATASTDTVPPTSTITSPAAGQNLQKGTAITITGSASDAAGVIGGVEVSTDSGATWHPAAGRSGWSYNWTPNVSGPASILARAVDDSGNIETPATSINVTVVGSSCPCTIWSSGTVPGVIDDGDAGAVELGVRFRSDVNGSITGIRFYKSAANTGTHIGNLWSSSGVRLATATFSGESASGWQQVNFSSPVAISANTTYIASYYAPRGHYSGDTNFFTSRGVDNGPLHALATGVDGSNGVYAYGATSAFPSSSYQSSNYWVDVVFDTNVVDTTRPTITGTSPAAGATGVTSTASVTATFSETLDVASVNGGTVRLFDPSNAAVPATVTYSGLTATLKPTAALGFSATYRAVVTGGNAGVRDTAGNPMASDFTWTFTTGAAPPPPGVCPCTIWSNSTVPFEIDSGDGGAVELGVKFRSDQSGSITGLRFYKAATNTGTHVANLWTTSGTLLATANFTSESGTGWQQVNFVTPITVAPNTTYVASYFAPNGHYSDNSAQFAAAGVDNVPLHALRDGIDGSNGLYRYGSSSGFPASSFQSTNYWVDVVFTPASTTTPPTVISVSPANNATGAGLAQVVSVTFSQPINPSTINSATFILADATSNAVPSSISYNAATATASLTPTVELSPLTSYTARVTGGTNGVKDVNGNVLAADFTWSFTTGSAPPASGPGGPILVVSNLTNSFTSYLAEILSAEGLKEYSVSDISAVSAVMLANYDVVVLGEMPLTSAQATMLNDWVSGGGNLIAMRPDRQLSGLLGLVPTTSTLSNGYLLVQNSSGPGKGISGETLQFHGSADLYTLNGASALASLYSTAGAATPYPAVTTRLVGTGNAAAFTYDLARSVVYTRQGNPAWSGQKRDGQTGPIRSDDLYFGAASFDPQTDWVDLSKVQIPQADEQQRLLANLILDLNRARKPLPKFWYLPAGRKAAVVMTGDDHANGGTTGRFNGYLAKSRTGCSVADWECIRGTSYIYTPTPLTNTQAASFVAQGFEIALHINTNCDNWTPPSLEDIYATQINEWKAKYTSLSGPITNRTHCIANSDYDTQWKVELQHGIRLDTTYYYWPPSWVNDRPGLFTGSGLPMRYSDLSGNAIDVYQAASQMTDESGQSFPLHIDTLLDNALGPKGYFGVFTANMHTDFNPSAGSDGSDAIVASAQARSVPVVTALQMLTWLDGRNSSSFAAISWNGSVMSFNITAASGARSLQAMLPTDSVAGKLVGLTFNGSATSFTVRTVKGVEYAFFSGNTGSYQASYGVPSASIISGTISGPGANGATVTLTGAATLATTADAAGNYSFLGLPSGSYTLTPSKGGYVFSAASQTVSVSNTYLTGVDFNSAAAPTLTALSLSPASVVGGNNSTGTVTVNPAAPSGGMTIALTSANPTIASVPANVIVPAGTTIGAFTVTTFGVSVNSTVGISASFDGVTKSANQTVTPATLSAISLNPTAVVGPASSTATVTLTGAASSSGTLVTLASANTAATVPANVPVAPGARTATFTVTTVAVSTATTGNISATLGATTRLAALTVNAFGVSTISLNPTSLVGGASSIATITLTAAAPAGGTVVDIASANSAATVPGTVTVNAGATTATFTITTVPVSSVTAGAITASYGTTSRSATLTVNPAALSSISRSPAAVVGGVSSTGTATLTGAAPPGGAVVTLSDTNAAASVPANVPIPAGATSATFAISTVPVTAATTGTVSGVYLGLTRTSPTLTVNPPALSTLTLAPTALAGGTQSTGTVTLTGAAAVNLTVTLSSNSALAAVPANIVVLAGTNSATFAINTGQVTANTNVTISAVYNGVTRNATLTIRPPRVASVTLNPSTVTGGTSSEGTVTLDGPAAAAGTPVTLARSNTAVVTLVNSAGATITSVTVPAGQTTATFGIRTTAVVANTSVTISATRVVTQSAVLIVTP